MCRVLSYLGRSRLIDELLYLPDNSFIKQTYNPQHMEHLLNLAGFGITAWDNSSYNPTIPYIYKSAQLPFYDDNLKNFVTKLNSHCFICHIRGVSYNENQIVSLQNLHPFIHGTNNIAFAHNGSLSDFISIKYDLVNYIKPEFLDEIKGTTDSEWIYAIFLSQLPKDFHFSPEVISHALLDTFHILHEVRNKHHIQVTSPINLFISNGSFIAATRFALDFGWPSDSNKDLSHQTYHSLWYTYGENYGYYDNEYRMHNSNIKESIIIASEPLTADTSTWIELPEYSLLIAWHDQANIKIYTQNINL